MRKTHSQSLCQHLYFYRDTHKVCVVNCGHTYRQFCYAQDGNAAISDYDYYRYNLPTMCDIRQLLFVVEVVDKYFDCYDGTQLYLGGMSPT